MLNAAIAAVCAGIMTYPNNAREACEKAFQAASIQSGVEEKSEVLRRYVESEAKKRVPQDAALAVTAFYTVTFSKEVRLNTGQLPFVQSTTVVIKPQSVVLTLSWSL
jgi:hypothetical protein